MLATNVNKKKTAKNKDIHSSRLERSTSNFSLQYPYSNKQTGGDNKETRQ